MRKNYQKKLNKLIRQLNQSIAEDPLWKGRFVFFQTRTSWWRFDDCSGGLLTSFIRGYDKETGYYHDYRLEYAPWIRVIYWRISTNIVNTFIVKDLDIWANTTRKEYIAEDYTKVKVDISKLAAMPYNFYMNIKDFKTA